MNSIMTKWWLIGAAAFIAVLLIASIVIVLLSEETEFAPGTPEAAVQTLLRAAENDDIETAYGMLSEDLQQKCKLQQFIDDNNRYGSYRETDFRATLRDTKLINGDAVVRVQITEFYGGDPFDSSQYSRDWRFVLQQQDGDWRFAEYPWPYEYCREEDN